MIKANVIAIDKIDKMEWNNFVSKEGTIFSSFEWVQIQADSRHEPLFFVVEDRDEIRAACAILNIKFISNFLIGKFIIQGNPIIKSNLNNYTQVVDLLFKSIEEEARKRHVISIEWNTLWSQWKDKDSLVKYGYQIRELGGWILDISGSEEEVYRRLRPSYKSLKNQAMKKHNVTTFESDDIYSMYKLWQETYRRAGKNLHSSTLRNLEQVYQNVGSKGMAKIVLGKRFDQLLCGAFILYHGDTMYYWHAGRISSERYGASHLLQWNLIKEGIELGYKYYHMGGSWTEYPDEENKQQAEGINMFKRGFGASVKTFYCGSKVMSPFKEMLYKKIISFRSILTFIKRLIQNAIKR